VFSTLQITMTSYNTKMSSNQNSPDNNHNHTHDSELSLSDNCKLHGNEKPPSVIPLNTQRERKYKWIPENFLKGRFLVPHNFYAPENEDHAYYVNDQLRYDLFYDAYSKISELEASLLKDENDFVKLKSVVPQESSLLANLYSQYWKKEDDVLSTEKWTMDINGKDESAYTVCCFQSPGDRFYTKVFPNSFYRFALFLYYNWSL